MHFAVDSQEIYYPEKIRPVSCGNTISSQSSSNQHVIHGKRITADEFAASTTLHGVSHWLGKQNPTFWRISYFIIWLALTAIMVFQLQNHLRQYLKYESKVSFEYGIADSLKFPSVTICPESMWKKSEVGGHRFGLEQWLLLYPFSRYRNPDQCLDTSIKDADRFSSADKIGKFWMTHLELEGGRQLTLPMKDVLIKCIFKMEEFDCAEHWFGHASDTGLCFTFNYANPVNTSRRSLLFIEEDVYKPEVKYVKGSGIYNGLRLLLSMEKNESCLLTSGSTNGFYMHIHDQNTIPTFVHEQSILLAPGTRAQVTVEVNHRNSSMTESLGKCTSHHPLYLYPDTPYVKDNCIMQCMTEDIWKECGCVNIYLPVDMETATERLNENFHRKSKDNITSIIDGICFGYPRGSCMLKVFEKYQQHGMSRCKTLCPEACQETKYNLQVSSVPYPSDQIVHHLIETTKFKTKKEIRDNLLEIDIFLQSMQYSHIIETRAITPWDLFSSIGGTLGLYLGASLLTILEVVEFILTWITGCNYRTAKVS